MLAQNSGAAARIKAELLLHTGRKPVNPQTPINVTAGGMHAASAEVVQYDFGPSMINLGFSLVPHRYLFGSCCCRSLRSCPDSFCCYLGEFGLLFRNYEDHVLIFAICRCAHIVFCNPFRYCKTAFKAISYQLCHVCSLACLFSIRRLLQKKKHPHLDTASYQNQGAFWCRWRGSNPHGIATTGF